ncbi:hypothetical protein KEJ18_04670 [Candidatus Bathyarchaeota archaeon]|nr:hypothetical protein [Candidatus Bathyarchaeota archaeon]
MGEEKSPEAKNPEPKTEDTFGLVLKYLCPFCGSEVQEDHVDDIGTKWFKCPKCGGQTAKPKSEERKRLEEALEHLKEIKRPVTLEEVADILNSTIKHDKLNKVIAFLTGLLTFTEEDQINLAFTAESSTGKSYIPLELAWYFPRNSIIEYSYVSPTAFFHEYGDLMTDPSDNREVEEKEKRKVVVVDLHQKILIFLDQPHDMLLQRIRPLLSHDRKTLVYKITDRKERSGLRTKTVYLNGYPTVYFCSAKFSMEDQERTRLLLLSPETTQEKLKDSILLKIQKEGDRQAFFKFMEGDPRRNWLRRRVEEIARERILFVVVPESFREKIAERFFEIHNSLIPRHQRDITRLLALIKAHAMLNLWHREKIELSGSVIVNEEDVNEGFKLYKEVSEANELGLPPEVYEIYKELEPKIPDEGITRKQFQALYYETFHRTMGKKRLEEILNLLESVGLFSQELDPNDKRQKLVLPTCRRVFISEAQTKGKEPQKTLIQNEKINTPQGVGNAFSPKFKDVDVLSVGNVKPRYTALNCDRCGKPKVIGAYKVKLIGKPLEAYVVCEDCGQFLIKFLRERDQP